MNGNSTGGQTVDCHRVWIASEVRNVVAHPLQRQNLILQTQITGHCSVLSAQESKNSKPVVHAYEYQFTIHDIFASCTCFRSKTEWTSMDVNQNVVVFCCVNSITGDFYWEIQTVFWTKGKSSNWVGYVGDLGTRVRFISYKCIIPWISNLWRLLKE